MPSGEAHPGCPRLLPDVGSMLAQCHRRWPSTDTSFGCCLVSDDPAKISQSHLENLNFPILLDLGCSDFEVLR